MSFKNLRLFRGEKVSLPMVLRGVAREFENTAKTLELTGENIRKKVKQASELKEKAEKLMSREEAK